MQSLSTVMTIFRISMHAWTPPRNPWKSGNRWVGNPWKSEINPRGNPEEEDTSKLHGAVCITDSGPCLFHFFFCLLFFSPFLATHFPLHARAQRWRETTWYRIYFLKIFSIILRFYFLYFCFVTNLPMHFSRLQVWKWYTVKMAINSYHLCMHQPLTCMCLITMFVIFLY